MSTSASAKKEPILIKDRALQFVDKFTYLKLGSIVNWGELGKARAWHFSLHETNMEIQDLQLKDQT